MSTIYHGELLVTMGDYNKVLKVDLKHVVIFK